MIDQFSTLLNLIDFLPELILIIALIMVLILDLFEENSIWIFRISLMALSVASLILVSQWIAPVSNTFFENYTLNGITIIFRCLIALSATFSILISEEYIRSSGMAVSEFLIFVLTATIGAFFISGANDLITLFVAIECLSLASYLLAGYSKLDIRSNEASMKYLLMGGASSAILAYGFSWLYGLSGGKLVFSDIFLALSKIHSAESPLALSLICILVAIFFKLSIVPFHQWAPDVYEGAPTPVVAFFSVTAKAAGFILAIRILTLVFPVHTQLICQPIFGTLSILTMIVGNVIALTQTNIKRLLAYSSISQVGYLSIAILYGESLGYTPLVLHILTYIFANIGAFACVILLGLKTGTDQLRDYNGLYFRDPMMTICLTICLLSLAGLPPFAGFFSKIYIFWSAWNQGFYALVYAGLITSVISIYYYLRIIKTMITKEHQEESKYIRLYKTGATKSIGNTTLELAIGICMALSSTLGFFFDPLIEITTNTLLIKL